MATEGRLVSLESRDVELYTQCNPAIDVELLKHCSVDSRHPSTNNASSRECTIELLITNRMESSEKACKQR